MTVLSSPAAQTGTAAATTLVVEHASVGYGRAAVLDDVTLSLGPGLHVLLGPNGSGKTTLFRALSGVLAPRAGTIRVDGRDPHRSAAARASVGVSGHRSALAARLDVRDNLEYWARLLGIDPARRTQRIRAVMAELDLDDLATRRAGLLSRGQAQRVSLAKAMLTDPTVLLLDEPLAGIDPAVAAKVRGHLRDLARTGRTVLVSSHELAEVDTMGDDVTVLRDGRVVAHGSAARLRADLVGGGRRLRLRGTAGLRAAVAAAGYEATDAPDGALELSVPGDEATRALVERVVGAGVGVYEVSVIDRVLEDIYLSVGGPRAGHGAAL